VFIYLGIPVINDPVSSAPLLQGINLAHNGFFTVPRNGSVLFQPFVVFTSYGKKLEILGDVEIQNSGDFKSGDDFSMHCPLVHCETR
jgi:hypothetical protein